jgi:hypothetical protein
MTMEDKAHGQEETQAAVQQERRQRSEERDTAHQTRHGQERAGRQGRQGQEPEAGHRHRPLESEKEGQEGSAQETLTPRKDSAADGQREHDDEIDDDKMDAVIRKTPL